MQHTRQEDNTHGLSFSLPPLETKQNKCTCTSDAGTWQVHSAALWCPSSRPSSQSPDRFGEEWTKPAVRAVGESSSHIGPSTLPHGAALQSSMNASMSLFDFSLPMMFPSMSTFKTSLSSMKDSRSCEPNSTPLHKPTAGLISEYQKKPRRPGRRSVCLLSFLRNGQCHSHQSLA